jgi:hypothetical protein
LSHSGQNDENPSKKRRRQGTSPLPITPSPAAALESLSGVALSSGRAKNNYQQTQEEVNSKQAESAKGL